MNKSQGYVYILTNPSFKEDWVKIGKSSRPVDVRSKELDNTAVPLPFEIFATLKTSKYNEVEKQIHKQIDLLTDLRIRNNREFFNVKPQVALEILKDIANLLDDAEIEISNETNTSEKKSAIHSNKINEQQFLSSLDANGVNAFTYLLKFAREKSYLIRWGTKGFSLNVSLDNGFVGLCFGNPPQSVYKQSIYAGIEEIRKKISNSDGIIQVHKKMLSSIPSFIKAGSYYKWIINKSYNENDMINFCNILDDLKTKIEQPCKTRTTK